MMKPFCFTLIGLALGMPTSHQLGARSDGSTAYVDLGYQKGSPQHLASGFIYGIPDTLNQIPYHWYSDIGFNYGRAGGAQEDAPSRGWIWGLTDYQGRLRSTLVDYQTCRQHGAKFIILPHDVWGTDRTNSSTVWPGDNGDWTDYDNFIQQLMSDLKANNALEGLVWDTWNEADLSFFWKRPQQQWLDLWDRTYKHIRSDRAFDSVLISGPTLAGTPYSNNTWWTNWLSSIKANNTIPDQWAYHLEVGPGTTSYYLQNTIPSLNSMLSTYDIPQRPTNINEYAVSSEQIPSGAAWWISQLERYDVQGLRGNWLSGNQLHDLMANLLTKLDNATDYASTAYAPAPEYTVYEYYNLNMTGIRVGTTSSTNANFDVYGTVQADEKVRILAGTQAAAGDWSIQVQNLDKVGLPSSGSVEVHALSFPGHGTYTPVYAPTDLGSQTYSYSDNVLVIPVSQPNNWTAHAFEFEAGKSMWRS